MPSSSRTFVDLEPFRRASCGLRSLRPSADDIALTTIAFCCNRFEVDFATDFKKLVELRDKMLMFLGENRRDYMPVFDGEPPV